MGESASPCVGYYVIDASEAPPWPSPLPRYTARTGPQVDGSDATIFRCTPLSCWEGGANNMIKWNYRTMRIALVLGSIAAFAVSAGANTKWGF